MKDKLLNALGTVGLILWYVLATAFVAVPIAATGLPWWAKLLILAAIMMTDLVGSLVSVGVYVYSFFIVINEPVRVFTFVYFLCLMCYLVFMLIPAICNIVAIAKARKEDRD